MASAAVAESGAGRRRANLWAKRQEKVRLPGYSDGNGGAFPIREFLSHPTGVEALLNTRSLQGFKPLDSNTYRFEGSKAVEQQNHLFSAFMRNHIRWDVENLEPCLVLDVHLKLILEVYTKPFSLLPLSAVEKPGNLLMQGLLDRLVPLLAEQLLSDYCSWAEQQMQSQS